MIVTGVALNKEKCFYYVISYKWVEVKLMPGMSEERIYIVRYLLKQTTMGGKKQTEERATKKHKPYDCNRSCMGQALSR